MAKKKKKLGFKAGKKPRKKEGDQQDVDEKEGPDYGGFPDRDLKKNLGCGG